MGYILNGIAVGAKLRVPAVPFYFILAQPEPTHDDSIGEFTESLREEGRAGQSKDLSDFSIVGCRKTCGREGVVEDACIGQ